MPADLVRKALARTRAEEADCLVAVGGGSSIGLAKALALETSLPIVAVPTTYAGSEMSSIYGITENRRKRTGRDLRVLPRCVIYDPELTNTLPKGASVSSGLNAMAHAVEGLYAHNGNPLISTIAEEGIRAMFTGLRSIARKPFDADARTESLYGAWLCGMVLGHVDMGLHHKLCHLLGGLFDLPHAETHAVLLPHLLSFNASAAPTARDRVCRALGCADAGGTLYDLLIDSGLPTSLRQLGLADSDIATTVDTVLRSPISNPRKIEEGDLRLLLTCALDGRRPEQASN